MPFLTWGIWYHGDKLKSLKPNRLEKPSHGWLSQESIFASVISISMCTMHVWHTEDIQQMFVELKKKFFLEVYT